MVADIFAEMLGEVFSKIIHRNRKRLNLGSITTPLSPPNMGQRGNQNVANVETIATQMYCTVQRTTSNACIAGVSDITKDVVDWHDRTDGAQRRLPEIDAGQVLLQSRMQKNPISILL